MELIPNLTTVLFEVINFAVLAILLYKFLFQPVMRNVSARAAEKEALLQQLREERDSASAMRAELEARLSRAEDEAEAILMRAQDQAEEERQSLLAETQAEVERILVETHAQAHQMRSQALDEFHEVLLDAILETSGSVIEKVMPDEVHALMVKQLSDRIWEMGRAEMRRVESFRLSLGDRVPTAHIQTAHPLLPESQGLLMRTFTALADRTVNLDIQLDPSLFVGVRVRLGDVVVDHSVAGQLDALRATVAETFGRRTADE